MIRSGAFNALHEFILEIRSEVRGFDDDEDLYEGFYGIRA